GGALRHRPDHGPVDERLAADEGDRGFATGTGLREQQIDSAVRSLEGHVLGLAAERALLCIAISAAEIAFLGDRQRKGMNRRWLKRRIVDERRPVRARAGEKLVDAIGRNSCTEACKQLGTDIEKAAPVSNE